MLCVFISKRCCVSIVLQFICCRITFNLDYMYLHLLRPNMWNFKCQQMCVCTLFDFPYDVKNSVFTCMLLFSIIEYLCLRIFLNKIAQDYRDLKQMFIVGGVGFYRGRSGVYKKPV